MVDESIRWLPNWKTPGHDQVYNFFIKKMMSLHLKLARLVFDAVMEPSMINEELYMGTTYLVPKKVNVDNPTDLRPITCLPNIFKLISKVVKSIVYEVCELNKVISPNQMGVKSRCQGAKEQALINKALNLDHNNELCTSWIDIRKAFDSVNHGYLIACLEKLELPKCVIEFVE